MQIDSNLTMLQLHSENRAAHTLLEVAADLLRDHLARAPQAFLADYVARIERTLEIAMDSRLLRGLPPDTPHGIPTQTLFRSAYQELASEFLLRAKVGLDLPGSSDGAPKPDST